MILGETVDMKINLFCKETKSPIEGLGLYTTKDIKANIFIGVTHIFDEKFENNYIRTPLGGFYNHSNEPNVQRMITNILPKDSQIKYNKKLNQKDLTFAFEANILVEDPEEFYKIIKKINNIDKSLSISYPLTFTNSNSNLDIKFIIHYYKSL